MPIDSKQELERLSVEARQTLEDAMAELERIRRNEVSPEHARAYAAARRARLWRMPAWLWVPIIVSLVGTSLLAAFVAFR